MTHKDVERERLHKGARAQVRRNRAAIRKADQLLADLDALCRWSAVAIVPRLCYLQDHEAALAREPSPLDRVLRRTGPNDPSTSDTAKRGTCQYPKQAGSKEEG